MCSLFWRNWRHEPCKNHAVEILARNEGAIGLSLSKQDVAILQRAGAIFGDRNATLRLKWADEKPAKVLGNAPRITFILSIKVYSEVCIGCLWLSHETYNGRGFPKKRNVFACACFHVFQYDSMGMVLALAEPLFCSQLHPLHHEWGCPCDRLTLHYYTLFYPPRWVG